LFKGIGVAPVAEIDHDLETLLRRQAGIPLRVCPIGILEAAEDPDRLLHIAIVAI
jgi:hypothetical protein